MVYSLENRAAQIALVRNQFFDAVETDFRIVRPRLGRMHSQLGHRHPGLDQRRIERGRIAQVGGFERHCHHRARVQIDGVLGLVGQVRTAILHLRDPCIFVDRTLPLPVRRALLALAVQPRQLFARRRLDARRLRQSR